MLNNINQVYLFDFPSDHFYDPLQVIMQCQVLKKIFESCKQGQEIQMSINNETFKVYCLLQPLPMSLLHRNRT